MKDSKYILTLQVDNPGGVPEIKVHNKRLRQIAAKLKRLEKAILRKTT